MKEIKAYIRPNKAEEVITALEGAGVPGLTAIEVKGIGDARSPEDECFSIKYAEKVSAVTKIEVVCRDSDTDALVAVIKKSAFTGHKGDGMIFVSEVTAVVKIRNDEFDDAALRSCTRG